jgi:hypothetical protein
MKYLYFTGCIICDRINVTIFKNHTFFNQTDKKNEIGSNFELQKLKISDNILIKIKSIQKEKNNIFIVADFIEKYN